MKKYAYLILLEAEWSGTETVHVDFHRFYFLKHIPTCPTAIFIVDLKFSVPRKYKKILWNHQQLVALAILM